MEYSVFGISLITYILISIFAGRYGIRGTVQNANNICPRTVTYEEQTPVEYTELEKEYYKTWCFAIPPRCRRHRWKTVHKTKIITSTKSKTINECCKGYLKVNEACVPICYDGCLHGKCVAPNRCACDEGWEGTQCQTPCKSHLYGKGCQKACNCMHNSTCDRKNGTCYCTPGYTGRYCQSPCSFNTYGLNCINKCQCKNEALCNVEDGSCLCQPGYFGEFCETPCESGFHGEKCLKSCLCFNETTAACSHVDGTCVCKPGYVGKYCEIECSNFTYGDQCEKKCDCENSDMCDPVTGECSCQPGWTGKRCADICPLGKFGESCQSDCLPCHNGTGLCNHITGSCECHPGYIGENCELRCPEGFWGMNCTEECLCLHGENCDAETGECICLPGWTGPACLNVCTDGFYGFKCLYECGCPQNATCDPENGDCTCNYGYDGDNCDVLVENQPRQHYRKNVVYSEKKTIIALCIFFMIVLIAFVIVFTFYRYKSRKNEVPVKEGVSTDTIIRVGFVNPNYETPDVLIENGKSSIEFFHNLQPEVMERNNDTLRKSIIPDRQSHDSIKDNKQGNRTSDRDSTTEQLKKISNIDAALENRLSAGSTTERKSVTFSNHSSSIYSSITDPGDEYEPEVLKEFKIIEENDYEVLPEKRIDVNIVVK